ncbi:MAG: hypothetical protein NTW57_07110 [Methylophilales bacterium]|nr:hypothetical protein [Methylophilales bacterium]
MVSWIKPKNTVGWTAIEVGEDAIYGVTVLAPLTNNGKPRVVKCGNVSASGIDAVAVSDLSKKLSVANCPWVMSLRPSAYNVLVVEEPSVLASEVEASLRWSISGMIDYPVSEANLDWMQIPTKTLQPKRTPHLYVLAASSVYISQYAEVFEQAKIPLQAVDVRETAQRNIATLVESPGEGVVLLKVSKHGVRLTTTFNGELYLDRYAEETALNQDAIRDDVKEQIVERVVLQAQRSLDFVARTLDFIDIKRVLLAPSIESLDFSEVIGQNLQVPAEKLDLASIFDFSQTPELMQSENQALYFYALGSALRFMNENEGHGQQINLLKQKKFELKTALVAPVMLGLLLLSLFGFGLLWGLRQVDVATSQKAELASTLQLQQANVKFQLLESQITEHPLPSLIAEIANLKQKALAAQQILSLADGIGSPLGYAQYFDALTKISEDGLWLTNVTVDKAGKSVRVSGNALNKDSVMRFAKRFNDRFASDGVMFTSLELTPVSVVKQSEHASKVTAVAFILH